MKRKKHRQHIHDKYGGRCAYCGCELEVKDMQIDHIISKYHHEYFKMDWDIDRMDNLNPSCRQCNFYKAESNIEQFRKKMTTLHERVMKPFIARLAIKYGIFEYKEWDGEFYFEKDYGSIQSKRQDNSNSQSFQNSCHR